MKKKKLSLKELKVESFVTATEEASIQTIKGGGLNRDREKATNLCSIVCSLSDPCTENTSNDSTWTDYTYHQTC